MQIAEEGPATEKQYIQAWLAVGQLNEWIMQAWDPPFTRESFERVETISDLLDRFEKTGSWPLGQAFYLHDAEQLVGHLTCSSPLLQHSEPRPERAYNARPRAAESSVATEAAARTTLGAFAPPDKRCGCLVPALHGGF